MSIANIWPAFAVLDEPVIKYAEGTKYGDKGY